MTGIAIRYCPKPCGQIKCAGSVLTSNQSCFFVTDPVQLATPTVLGVKSMTCLLEKAAAACHMYSVLKQVRTGQMASQHFSSFET